MIRQERRFSIRKLQKELQQIKKDRNFIKVINDEKIESLSPQEFELLKKHEHTDKELQAKFDFGRVMLARVKELEQKINKLKYIKS